MQTYGSTKSQHQTGRLVSHNTGHLPCGDLNRGRRFNRERTRAARKAARRAWKKGLLS